jgi:hypothetical protein
VAFALVSTVQFKSDVHRSQCVANGLPTAPLLSTYANIAALSTHLNTDRVNRQPDACRYSANKQRMAACHMLLLADPAPAAAATAEGPGAAAARGRTLLGP